MTRPATASSIESSPLPLPCEPLAELPLGQRLGRRWPVYPGGGAESE